ncbi:MAG: J domain-containing protein [Alphaproteobacteria bacterium]|nr:J domain-containing protein [Alphaproteobacteria bacterium]
MPRKKSQKARETIELLEGLVDIGIRLYQFFDQEVQAGHTKESSPVVEDPYRILGLPANATLAQVKKRYRQLSWVYHPDLPDGFTEAMKRVNLAYEQIVKDKKKA